jgi:thiol-disulfide isomerase/thioredoxin
MEMYRMSFDFKPFFDKAMPYGQLLEQCADTQQRQRWQNVYDSAGLSDQQKSLLAGFRRKMNVLCLTGVWCGDCVNACPIFQRIAEAADTVDLRFVHREQKFDPAATDAGTKLANELSICGGPRVPVFVFLSQDGFECERFGERTLATYRMKVASMQGAACSTGLFGPPTDLLQANIAEWLTHFERVQLMLQTSPRLMKLNGEV